ncbi:MAG: SRPBCC family protein [Planktomarina sp.]
MKLSTREDVGAPAGVVFDAVSNFDEFERMVAQKGANIVRLDGPSQKSAGMAWDLGFKFRGRDRKAKVSLAEFQPPKQLKLISTVGGLDVEMLVLVTPLSPSRSRVQVVMDLKPQTLSARLLTQSMKLAKSRLNDKFKARIADYAGTIEREYRADAA